MTDMEFLDYREYIFYFDSFFKKLKIGHFNLVYHQRFLGI